MSNSCKINTEIKKLKDSQIDLKTKIEKMEKIKIELEKIYESEELERKLNFLMMKDKFYYRSKSIKK